VADEAGDAVGVVAGEPAEETARGCAGGEFVAFDELDVVVVGIGDDAGGLDCAAEGAGEEEVDGGDEGVEAAGGLFHAADAGGSEGAFGVGAVRGGELVGVFGPAVAD
jgi:hypothetical protein